MTILDKIAFFFPSLLFLSLLSILLPYFGLVLSAQRKSLVLFPTAQALSFVALAFGSFSLGIILESALLVPLALLLFLGGDLISKLTPRHRVESLFSQAFLWMSLSVLLAHWRPESQTALINNLFGDIVSLDPQRALLSSLLCALLILTLFWKGKAWLQLAFEESIGVFPATHRSDAILLKLALALVLSVAILNAGLLLSFAFLLFPTWLHERLPGSTFKSKLLSAQLACLFATWLGFLISLSPTGWPSSASITFTLSLLVICLSLRAQHALPFLPDAKPKKSRA